MPADSNSDAHTIFENEHWGSYEFMSDIVGVFLNGFVRETSVSVASDATANSDITVTGLVMSTDTPLSFGGNSPDIDAAAEVVTTTGHPDLGLEGGAITKIILTNPGSGYTSAPTVTLSGGGGSGATAVARIRNGRVEGVVVTAGGSGYTSAPTVAFAGGGSQSFGPSDVSITADDTIQVDEIVRAGTYTLRWIRRQA